MGVEGYRLNFYFTFDSTLKKVIKTYGKIVSCFSEQAVKNKFLSYSYVPVPLARGNF